jgi:TRAP-type uncharacterized transport system substrate-binding protein
VDNLVLLRHPKPDELAKLLTELRQKGVISAAEEKAVKTYGVSVALLQGGVIAGPDDAGDLETLGAVFNEPVWLFGRRGDVTGNGLAGLRGKTVAVGTDGSGTQKLALELLRRHGISDLSALRPQALDENTLKDLLARKIDAGFIVASWSAPSVQKLLQDERVELWSYSQADVYADLYPYLHKVVLHHGAIDLAKDRPADDKTLIAAKASLVVHKLHPAIQYLLLNAAKQIHGQQAMLQAANEFPSAEAINLPLSTAAQQFYKSSLPYFVSNFLRTYLPFWIAEPVNELLIPLLILITGLSILGPLFRLVPVLVTWMMQRPVFRLLSKVTNLELLPHDDAAKAEEIARRLDALEKEVINLQRRGVPAAVTAPLMILRQHIDALRERLKRYAGKPEGSAGQHSTGP